MKDIKSMFNNDTRLIENRAKLVTLQMKLLETEAEINNLEAQTARRKDETDRLARGLLDSKSIDTMEIKDLEAPILAFKKRRKILIKAIEIQRKRMVGVEEEVGREIMRQILPDYSQKVTRIADALLVMVDAAKEEREFWNNIRSAGMSYCGLQTGAFNGQIQPGDLMKSDSGIAYWFRSNIEAGYIKQKDVPDYLQDAWGFQYYSGFKAA